MRNNHFNLQRTGLLIRSDLSHTYKRDLLILAGLFVLSLIYFMTVVKDGIHLTTFQLTTPPARMPDQLIKSAKFHFYCFPITLLLGGLILTSLSFWELKRKDSRQFFLSLPASTLEKGFSKWFISGILFPLAWLLLYQLFAFSTYNWMMNHGFAMVRLPLLDAWVWLWIGVFALLQSIFFLGAIVFPRFSFVKTVLVLTCMWVLIRFLYLFTVENIYPLFSSRARELAASENWKVNKNLFLHGDQWSFWTDQMPGQLLIVLICGLIPLLAYVSYLKIKEKEL